MIHDTLEKKLKCIDRLYKYIEDEMNGIQYEGTAFIFKRGKKKTFKIIWICNAYQDIYGEFLSNNNFPQLVTAILKVGCKTWKITGYDLELRAWKTDDGSIRLRFLTRFKANLIKKEMAKLNDHQKKAMKTLLDIETYPSSSSITIKTGKGKTRIL